MFVYIIMFFSILVLIVSNFIVACATMKLPRVNKSYLLTNWTFKRQKVKVRTADIAPFRESSPQKRSGIARVLKGSHTLALW